MKTANRELILKATKKWAECGCCDHLHPADWWGDCRDDDHRFRNDEVPEDADIEYIDYDSTAVSKGKEILK